MLIEGIAWADEPLAQARKAVAESDYVAARPVLAAALDAGGNSPEDTAEIYRLTGIVDAALGDAKAATEAFKHLLALSPKATLPVGTSPKITRPFEAAARSFSSSPQLELKIETEAAPPTIILVVLSDALGMVAKAHVVYSVDRGPERTKVVVASERTEIALPEGQRIDARVTALDRHGNRLVEIGSQEVPIVIVGPAGPAPVATRPDAPVVGTPRSPGPPVYRRWWPYAAASGVFAGAAGYFAWQVRSDANELERLTADSARHTFGEAKAVEDRGRRNALFTNIGLGVAGAFAIAAGAMYVFSPRETFETRVSAVPVPGGGAFVLGGKF